MKPNYKTLEHISDRELQDLAESAESGNLEASEALVREELWRRRAGRQALSNGVYDASQDVYETAEHPEDDQWIIRGED